MSTVVIPIIKGSNPPIELQLYDRDTDAPLVLTGATMVSATAKADGVAMVALNTPTVTDAANGKIRITYTTGAFTNAGTYTLQIKLTDAAGITQIYPSEPGQTRVKVSAANA